MTTHYTRTGNEELKGDIQPMTKKTYTVTQGEVEYSSTQEIEDLGKAISVVDYLINEGVVFHSADLKTLSQWGEQLQNMAQSANMRKV